MSGSHGQAPAQLDVVPVLPEERDALLGLLTSLSAEDWERPSECPAWTVKGIALHVLGDDLSLLARQRDSAVPGLFLEAALPGREGEPVGPLDRFNERWVQASTFLSPALIIELLRLTGEWTHAWYATVDPARTGEPVMLFGRAEPAPYWQIAAREYLERWVHQLQVRRALELSPGALGEGRLLEMGVAIVVRALPGLLTAVAAPAGTSIVLSLGDTAWTYRRHEDGQWSVGEVPPDDPTVTVHVDRSVVATLLSRGLARDAAEASLEVGGDPDLSATIRTTVAAVVSR